MKRKATAVWNGSGKEGTGHVTTGSMALDKMQYSYKSRFEEGTGTNPEELVAAAHAGCFIMKLSFVLGNENYTPEVLEAQSIINFEDGILKSSHLVLKAKVPGISKELFNTCVQDAKENCPISKALNMDISVEAELV